VTKERSAKQQARDEQLRRQAKGRKSIDPSKDSLVHAIIKLGGLSMKERKDITRDTKGSNPRLPFIGTLFTEKGRGLDVIAQALEEYGYLSKDDLDSVDGGIGRLREMIDDEINGTAHYSTHRDIGAAMADKYDEQDLAETGYNDAPPDVQAAVEKLVDAQDDEAAAERAALQDESPVTEGMSDEEVDQFFAGWEQETSGIRGTEGAATDQAAAGSEDREGAPEAAAQKGESLDLTSQSADEILAAEKAAQKRDADKAAADKQADDKARADRERGDFTLAGSDRKADQNVNQDDIFSVAAAIKPAPAPAAIVEASPKENVADFGEKIGGARKDTAVPLGKRPIMPKAEDARPAWARKYVAMEQMNRRCARSR
jgi:hypothetical protein